MGECSQVGHHEPRSHIIAVFPPPLSVNVSPKHPKLRRNSLRHGCVFIVGQLPTKTKRLERSVSPQDPRLLWEAILEGARHSS